MQDLVTLDPRPSTLDPRPHMPLLDRLRQELDRAGQSAQRALDEGRIRLDLFRARQSLDRFAQRFGHAVYLAKKAGNELPAEEMTAHMGNLTAAEAEVTRLETLVNESAKERKGEAESPLPRERDSAESPSSASKPADEASQSSPPPG